MVTPSTRLALPSPVTRSTRLAPPASMLVVRAPAPLIASPFSVSSPCAST